MDQALRLAVEAARLGARRGFYFAGADVATRVNWAMDLVRDRTVDDALDLIYRLVRNGRCNARGRPRGDGHLRDRAG
jgi:hypothetical protein